MMREKGKKRGKNGDILNYLALFLSHYHIWMESIWNYRVHVELQTWDGL